MTEEPDCKIGKTMQLQYAHRKKHCHTILRTVISTISPKQEILTKTTPTGFEAETKMQPSIRKSLLTSSDVVWSAARDIGAFGGSCGGKRSGRTLPLLPWDESWDRVLLFSCDDKLGGGGGGGRGLEILDPEEDTACGSFSASSLCWDHSATRQKHLRKAAQQKI